MRWDRSRLTVVNNRWRVDRAFDAVSELRRLLHSYRCSFDATQGVEPADLAQAYLACQVIHLEELTDRRAMEYLAREWGVDTSEESFGDAPLAGGLYVAESGTHRWIFVEPGDHPRRRKFTIAHEIGHLVREALPHVEREACSLGAFLNDTTRPRLLKYGRCSLTRHGTLTGADKRELDAHDFAAELLMPREGVLGLLRTNYPSGFQRRRQIEEFARLVASTYGVSLPAAELHVSNFSFSVLDEEPNGDLFSAF